MGNGKTTTAKTAVAIEARAEPLAEKAGFAEITGTPDHDKIKGSDGNDSLSGAEGRDALFGRAGDDTLAGGGGDDTMFGGEGADTFRIGADGGNDQIADFSLRDGDRIELSFRELTSFDQIEGRMGAHEGGTIIKFDDGATVFLRGVPPEILSKDSFIFDPPVCFHTGTTILTPRGPCPVEELRPGDLVMTRDHGPQPLLWVTRSLHGPPEPPETWQSILIAPGALGPGIPGRPLRLSPQHRVMIVDPATGAEVLVAARKLVERRGIRALRGQRSADYVHLLLERHALLWAEGAAAETMLVAPASRHRLPPDLSARLPDMQPARPILRTDPALRARCAPIGTAVRCSNGRIAPAATPTGPAP